MDVSSSQGDIPGTVTDEATSSTAALDVVSDVASKTAENPETADSVDAQALTDAQTEEPASNPELKAVNSLSLNDAGKNGKKVPYKSFRKKYLKMEIQFTAAMAKSEELYKQKLLASKVFNRLLREKSRLLDILLGLQESNHLQSQLAIDLNSPPPEPANFHDDVIWNDNVKHLAQLYSEAYENTSDEEAEAPERNPMGLIEWLRRNQPSVFTAETLDPKKNVVDKALAGQKPGSGGAAAGGAEKTPTKKRKAADTNSVSKSSRKRKATTQEDATEGVATSAASAPQTEISTVTIKAKRIKKEE